jgi:hypothetical protein
VQATLERERGQGPSKWEAGTAAVDAALFRVRVVENRTRINSEHAALKLRGLDAQLRGDPRLAAQLAGWHRDTLEHAAQAPVVGF